MQFDTKRHKGRGHYYDKYFGAWDQEGIERSCSHFYLCALNKQAWRQTLQDCSNQYEHLVAPKNKINFGIQTNSIPIGRKSNSK
jgi:hypothetical protein